MRHHYAIHRHTSKPMNTTLAHWTVCLVHPPAAKSLDSPAGKSTFSYGSLTNPTIINNGHTLQVSLPADFKSDVKIPIRGEEE